MNIYYEIEETTNAVKIFFDDKEEPTVYQPHWPNGDDWSDHEEAKSWAETAIDFIKDKSKPMPSNYRNEETKFLKDTEDAFERTKKEREDFIKELKEKAEQKAEQD